MALERDSIKRIERTMVVDVSEDNNSVETQPFEINGRLRRAVVVVPDLDSTNTATLNVVDQEGQNAYQKTAMAESATSNNTGLDVALAGDCTLQIVTSGNQTADRTFTVVLYVEN